MAKLPTLALLREDMFGVVGNSFEDDPFMPVDTKKTNDIYDALDKAHEYVWFAPRHYIENDRKFIHILPYTIVRLDGKILGYNRASSGSEGRLHGNFSIGIGGHIDMADSFFDEDNNHVPSVTTLQAMYREIIEETGISPDQMLDIKLKAIMYDDSNDVGAHHIAFVSVIEVIRSYNPDNVIRDAEEHLLNARWLTVEEALAQENPESWTRILLFHAAELGL